MSEEARSDRPAPEGPSQQLATEEATASLGERSSLPTLPRSYLGARISLVLQVLINTAIGLLGYPLVVGFAVMAGYSTAQYHDLTQGFIFFTVLPSALHLLAVFNIGITRRGSGYLGLSITASIVQVVTLVAVWGPYGLCIAPVIGGLAALAVVNGRPGDDSARIAALPFSRARVIADVAVTVLSVLLLIALVLANNAANDVENRHPAREFDSSESDERLSSALDPVLATLAEVEGMPDPVENSGDESPCEDGGHTDPDWSETERTYRFEDRDAVVDISPNAGAGLRAIEAVRTALIEEGWQISSENRSQPWLYDLYAVRDDGVRISFEVGAGMTRLWAGTGCVRNAEGEDP